jgi:hypothetical protein
VHPHQLRHSFAHAWLADGGAEGRATSRFENSGSAVEATELDKSQDRALVREFRPIGSSRAALTDPQ